MRISDWSSDVCSSDLDAFGIGGDDAGAIDAQRPALADQPKFDRVPIKARKLFQRVEFQAAQAALAIGLHIIGEHRVGEHRDMAENVVKDVGRSEEHTSELKSLMRISYAAFCLKKTKKQKTNSHKKNNQ